MESRVFHLRTPISDEEIEKLRVGDVLYVTGIMVTARDEAHKKILETLEKGEKLPTDLRGLVLYHCGPVVRKNPDGTWTVVAAGPTTSMRMESVEAEFIEKTGVKIVVGKGGMGARTAEAMKKHKAVYAVFTGGAGALAGKKIKRVIDVYWLEELGIPEAVWVFEVEEFGPLVVTIDAHGNNFYEEQMKKVRERAEKIKEELLAKLKER